MLPAQCDRGGSRSAPADRAVLYPLRGDMTMTDHLSRAELGLAAALLRVFLSDGHRNFAAQSFQYGLKLG